MAKNNDDLIEAFQGYFSAANMTPDGTYPMNEDHARAVFRFLSVPGA